jgi:hypothetical protein
MENLSEMAQRIELLETYQRMRLAVRARIETLRANLRDTRWVENELFSLRSIREHHSVMVDSGLDLLKELSEDVVLMMHSPHKAVDEEINWRPEDDVKEV